MDGGAANSNRIPPNRNRTRAKPVPVVGSPKGRAAASPRPPSSPSSAQQKLHNPTQSVLSREPNRGPGAKKPRGSPGE